MTTRTSRTAITAAGDVDGDGHADLFITHDEESDGSLFYTGAVYLVLGSDLSGEMSLALAEAKIKGKEASDCMGHGGAAAIGDIDDDGFGDFLASTYGRTVYGRNSGVSWLFHGPLSGTSTADDVASAGFYGDGASWGAGAGNSGGQDLTGDGLPDIAISAQGAPGDATGSGVVFLLPGNPL